ncbi:MAG: extracellular solute-binding protein family 5 [Thermomicrobiales bacterium]|nr:extracellular solute-binding protein family 5 [Thermomicrobiales bacterium]
MLSRSSTTTPAGGRAVSRRSLLQWLVACVLITGLMPWAMLSTAAQDGTPAAEAAQVVGELPDISVAETTGGTLSMGVSFDATNFDPTQTQDNMSLWVEMQIFSRLVRVNNVGTDLEGDLAESWDISEDGTEYTFHLRPDAMFGDGTPVTADDVVFSFERAMGEESLIGWTFEAVESVEAVDPATVKITLTAPAAPFANDMALWGASVVSKAAAEAAGDDFGLQPMGSGPFMLDSWQKGEQITLVKNPHYWEKDAAGNALPYLDQVNVMILSDDNTRMLQLQAGEIDVALAVPYNQLAPLSQNPALVISATPLYGITNVSLNQSKPEFTDINIRQAMNYAVDREAMVQTALFGYGRGACSPINLVWFYTDEYCYTYDLDKAKQLMAESSAPDGFATSLMVYSGDTVDNQLAVMLKDMLAQINIDVTIEPIDPATHWERWTALDYDMVMGSGTSDNLDPNANMLFCCVSDGGAKSSYTGWVDPEVDEIFRATQAEMDFDARGELYDEFQRLVMERGPFIELVHQVNRYGAQVTTHNFFLDPTGHWHLEYVWKE